MENPRQEIAQVVKLITTAETPEIQKAALEKYFVREAAFNHPLAKVNSSYRSRDSILGIYQWYRNMSPRITLEVEDVVYDPHKLKAFLNISQKFHIFLSPFKPASAHLLVRVSFIKSDNLYYIKQQEDFYQPEDIANLVIPPLSHVVTLVKYIGALASNVNTWAFQLFGFWRPSSKVSHIN